ncbi:MAG: hypothetical protein GQ524_08895 [Anaerolineales bacterium]|nr:hypothetical protein [Anaerolineales bacterium]
MSDSSTSPPKQDPSLQPLLRSILLEIAIYVPVVAVYFWLILRHVSDKFTSLYQDSLVLYALAATLAIVVQGVLLEMFTSWLLRRFGLRH